MVAARAVAQKPKVLFAAKVERRRYFRRFMWMLLGTVAAVGASFALDTAAGMRKLDYNLVSAGEILALVVAALLALRALLNLLRWLTTRSEAFKIYDKGFAWQRKGKMHKYGWLQVLTFREGVHSVYIFGRPLFQRGAITLTMRDGEVFKVTGRHGDTRRFLRAVRPRIAEVTGAAMARSLRNNKSVRLHPQLAMVRGGLVVGNRDIGWDEADVRVNGSKLVVRKIDQRGKFRTVRKYDIHRIDNLGGFMELASTTIKNHQPERYNIKTAGGAYVN